MKRVNTFVDFRIELVEGSSKRAGTELEQEVAIDGAPEAAEDAPVADEGAPAIPALIRRALGEQREMLDSMACDFSRFSTWTVVGLSQMMSQAGFRYTSYADFQIPYIYLFQEKTESVSAEVVAAAKLPVLNPNEFELWKMKIEQYFLMTDYALWKVILNGDSPLPTRIVDGVETVVPPTTVE
ncbi:hypothetical protein Tco_1503046 [Tanacetum coccineum]